MDSLAEQCEPLDRLVAEHEANVAVGDLAAPAPHRSSGDLLLEALQAPYAHRLSDLVPV
jgi:hypothetical protein